MSVLRTLCVGGWAPGQALGAEMGAAQGDKGAWGGGVGGAHTQASLALGTGPMGCQWGWVPAKPPSQAKPEGQPEEGA